MTAAEQPDALWGGDAELVAPTDGLRVTVLAAVVGEADRPDRVAAAHHAVGLYCHDSEIRRAGQLLDLAVIVARRQRLAETRTSVGWRRVTRA